MDILTDQQHRALAFVHACNQQRYSPRQDEVELWLREPTRALTGLETALLSLAAAASVVIGQGTTTDQLVRLGWAHLAEENSRLTVSELGGALLRDAEEKAAEVVASATVVLGSDDPLSYAALMSELAAAGAGMLIDPYVRRAQLVHIVQDTKLDRLLISEKVGVKDLAAMRSFLTHIPTTRGLEVRVATEAHDRYLQNEDGEVFIIGSSLNMVALQRATTVFTPVPSGSVAVFQELLQKQWAAGAPLRVASTEPEVEITDD